MNKCILLCVDADLSPATQYALHTISELLKPVVASGSFVLLTVIPLATPTAFYPGLYTGQFETITPSSWQYQQAQGTLQKARLLLQNALTPTYAIEEMIRTGPLAEEVVQAAREVHASLIVLGWQETSLWQRLLNFLAGDAARRVLQSAPCPVLLVAPPQPAQGQDLSTWYSDALTRYLHDHTCSLSVFTPQQVAEQFLPPHKKTPGRRERRAAAHALEQLARTGQLCRHDVKGELRYVND